MLNQARDTQKKNIRTPLAEVSLNRKSRQEIVKILLIEDNPQDAERLLKLISQEKNFLCHVDCVGSLAEGLKRLDSYLPHIILTDLFLNDSQGFLTVVRLRESTSSIPIIVLTTAHKELGVEAVRRGAQDYLFKEHLDGESLVRAIRYAMEHKRDQEALINTNAKFQAIFSALTDILFVLDNDGTICEYNTSAVENLYMPPEKFLGKKMQEILPTDIGRRFFLAISECLKSKSLVSIEYALLVSAGEKNFEARMIPFSENRIIAIVRDITQRKKAEKALSYRIEFEKLITNVSTNFIHLTFQKIDEGISQALKSLGEFADVDRSYVFLYSKDGKKFSNTHEWCAAGIIPQINRLQNLSVETFPWFNAVLQKKEVFYAPHIEDLPEIAAAEKKEFQGASIKSLICVPMILEGLLIGFIGFDSVKTKKDWPEDIIALLKIVGQIFASALERKIADETLRAEEAKLRHIIDLTPNFLYVKDIDGRFIIMNQAMARWCETTPDQAIGKKDSDFVKDKKEWEKVRQDDLDVFKTGQKKFIPEWTITNPAGNKTITLQTTKIPFKIPGTQTSALVGISVDITERKKSEEFLKINEERYKRLLQSATDYIYTVVVKDGRPVSTFHGPGCLNVTGYTNQDYENDPNLWYRMIYEEDRKNVIDQVAMALKGINAAPIEHRIIHKDGSVRWIRNALVMRKDKNGRVVNYDGLITDITARRHVEEKLRQSEAKYRLLFDHVPAGVCHVDLSGKFVYVNDVFCRMLETTPEDILGKTFKNFLHPDQISLIWNLFQEAVCSGKPSAPYHETKCVTASGKIIDIIMTNTLIRDDGLTGFQTMIQDVTERRKIEGIMREQSAAMKAAIDGMAILNNKIEFIYLNEAHARIYGYDSPDELISKSWKVLYQLHEIERIEKEAFPVFRKEGKWRGEAVGKKKDGSLFPQEISLTAIEGGGLVCVVRDITDRKKAEKALYYRIEFEKIIDTISTQFINLTPDKIDEGINQALKVIGEFFQVDRSFAFLYSERIGRVKHIYEWCAPDIISQAHRLENAPASAFPWFEKTLRQEQVISIKHLYDLPLEAKAEKEEFEAQKIKSLISVPMIYEGLFVGFVGFDSIQQEREWSEDTIVLLKIIGEIFTNAIQRKISEEQLIKLNRCFLNFGPDPIKNINALVTLCGELLEADCALYNRIDSQKWCVVGKWNTPDDFLSVDKAEGHICHEILKTTKGELAIVRNLQETKFAQNDTAVKKYGLKTYIGQPIKFGESFPGILCVVFKQDFIPTASDMKLMGVVSSAIGIEEERRRMEEALRKSETLLRTVFDTIPHWVFVKDTRSRFLLVNRKMAFDHGVSPSDMIYLPTEQSPLGTDEEKAFFIGVDQQVFSTGELVEILDEKITKPSGETRHYHIIKVPLKDSLGNVIGLVAVGQDITERKKAQEELDEYRKHLEELVEERTRELRHSERLAATGRLAASIAHEINNPLQGITTHLEIMHDHLPSNFEKLKNYEFVKSNIEKIRGIVSKLLDTYRGTDEGKAAININEIVDTVASLTEHQLNLKNINLKINLAKDIPPVEGWKQQLHQVFLNLILNAQDSIKGKKGTITITTSASDGFVLAAIADTGEGIRQQDLDHLFEPFFTTKESGTGLGLFVSQGIIKEHQGLIKVKSELGKGSIFTVTLPVINAGNDNNT